MEKEHFQYTTTGLAHCACKKGHEVFYMDTSGLVYYSDEQVGGHARKAPDRKFRDEADFLKAIREAPEERITAADLDVLMLRNDPSEDIEKRPWAQHVGILFGQMAANQGVIVLNDPVSLSNAINKIYFQYFPREVRPKTLITRDVEDIKAFFKETKRRMVLKPLQGSGGRNVFLVTMKEASNIHQMFEAISRDGYVVAQEYLPEAKKGDIRLFLMNGKPIEAGGKIAALNRLQADGDIRSNIHRGGKASRASVGEKVLELGELVMPKLIEDGMFLAGLDIVGDKVMEINVFSPGGLSNASELCDVDFFSPVIEAIERKVAHRKVYPTLPNIKIATL